MNGDELRALQAPIKERYRQNPSEANVSFRAEAIVDISTLTANIPTTSGMIQSSLHVAAGGPKPSACSGDMLLESLVACAGVTLSAVATAMSVPIESARIHASAAADFRGTLGIDRTIPIGITDIQLDFEIQSSADAETLQKLVSLTERYCIILQTLKNPPAIHATLRT